MPANPATKDSAELSGQVKLLRVRVTIAQSTLKEARKQASRAEQQRKLAKLLARRCRKGPKKAKAELADARAALAHAEVELIADEHRRAARRKTGRTGTADRSAAPAAKTRSATQRNVRTASRGGPPTQVSVGPAAMPGGLQGDPATAGANSRAARAQESRRGRDSEAIVDAQARR